MCWPSTPTRTPTWQRPLGIADADRLVPIAEMKELIFERTEAQPGSIGGFFKLNPKVDDLPDALSAKLGNIKLMRLGGVKKGGAGCICPESTLLRALVTHIVLARDEVVVMDMEAGIEHLGRATAAVRGPAAGGGGTGAAQHRYGRTHPPAGRRNRAEPHRRDRQQDPRPIRTRSFSNSTCPILKFLGFCPYQDAFIEADLQGVSPYDVDTPAKDLIRKIAGRL